MEEKQIIKGNFSKSNIFVTICLVSSAISFLISVIIYFALGRYDIFSPDPISYFEYLFEPDCLEGIAVCFYLGIAMILIAIFFIYLMNRCELSVSNKKVSGKTSFGRKVDLPLDMISSVGTCFPNGIAVATSSGRIMFWLLVNRDEVYQAISDLLKERQSSLAEKQSNSIDDIKKLKDLLDMGVITQEEFEAKKKQLLGL